MKKYIYYLWMIVTALGFVSCNDEDETVVPGNYTPDLTEDRGVEPGPEYNREEGVKYLNVIYLVPQDMEAQQDWHWRLSGIMSHVQDFYKDRLTRIFGVEENFRMVRNKTNPAYINILLVKGKRAANAYTSISYIQKEVEAYFREHADQKWSHHTLVLLPENVPVSSGVIYGYDTYNIPNEYLAVAACDAANFNIKYYGYTGLRNMYLKKLGEAIRTTGLAMGMTYNMQQKNDVYASVTALPSESYAANPDKWRLTPADKEMLTATELFQQNADYEDLAIVTMQQVKLNVENNSIKAQCSFISTIKPVVLFVYNDFFRALDEDGLYSEEAELRNENMETIKDAMLFYTDEIIATPTPMGYMCNATVNIPLNGIPEEYLKLLPGQDDYAKAELRFRILHENGTYTPSLVNTRCGTFYRDADPHPDRFRYFYFLNTLGNVVQPMPYDSHPDFPVSKDTWTVASDGYMGNVLKSTLLDGQTNVPLEFNDWTTGHKTQITVTTGWGYIHGIKIHPGNLDSRVTKVSVDVTYLDLDNDFGGGQITRRMVDNFKFIDKGEYYYYLGLSPDRNKEYYVYSFTITLEEVASGKTAASLAEIGTFKKY